MSNEPNKENNSNPLIKELCVAIGHYSIQVSQTGELAPPTRLVNAIENIKVALHAQTNRSGVDPEMGPILDGANDGELAFYDFAVQQHCKAVKDILDGKDTGAGANNEPWSGVRKRLLNLVNERAQAAQAVPDGFALVPKRATNDQLAAGNKVSVDWGNVAESEAFTYDELAHIYSEMIDAAPSAPAPEAALQELVNISQELGLYEDMTSAPAARRYTEDNARQFFNAGWKAAALFCDRDDVVSDGIVGNSGCPQFEKAYAEIYAQVKESGS